MNASIRFAEALSGTLNTGKMILNDYILTIEPTENGHKLIARRGSEVQELPVLNGTSGKSAYQYAVEAGYVGTEDQFAAEQATKVNWFMLEEKPVTYEPGGGFLRWDGSFDPNNTVLLPETLGEDAGVVHISDSIPTAEDFADGCMAIAYIDARPVAVIRVDAETCRAAFMDDGAATIGEAGVYIIPRDNYTLNEATFPKAGTYLLLGKLDEAMMHVGRLVIPGYTGYEQEVILPEYLPEAAHGKDGVGIESIMQTGLGMGSGAQNVWEVTLTDGRKETFTVYNGEAGSPGFSPTIRVAEETSEYIRLSITAVNGSFFVDIPKGKNGKDGFSPTIDVAETDEEITLTITDVNGEQVVSIPKIPGPIDVPDNESPGDGTTVVSPTIQVKEDEDYVYLIITDASGSQTATIPKGKTSALPTVTEEDNGKILTVVNGTWATAELPKYNGEYVVVPATEDQELLTAQMYLDANLRIEKIPYSEVTNAANGVTATIG